MVFSGRASSPPEAAPGRSDDPDRLLQRQTLFPESRSLGVEGSHAVHYLHLTFGPQPRFTVAPQCQGMFTAPGGILEPSRLP